MGYKNLSKVIVLRAIPMVEGAIIVLRRAHLQTISPCQWHITRGDHTIEKEFRRRPLNNVTLVTATHKGFKKVLWDKHSSGGLNDQQMKG